MNRFRKQKKSDEYIGQRILNSHVKMVSLFRMTDVVISTMEKMIQMYQYGIAVADLTGVRVRSIHMWSGLTDK